MSDGAVHAMEAAVECNDLPSPPPPNSVNGQVETPSRSSKGEAKALSPPVTDAFTDEDVDTGIGRRTRSKVRKEVDPKPKDDSVDDEVCGKTECTDGKSKGSLTARLVREQQPESVIPEESQSSYRRKKEDESIDSAAQSNGEVQTIRKVSKTESTSTGEGQGKASQTIIVTETRSLAKVINEAVRKDSAGQSDGKPTLVIIETKSGSGGQSAGISSGIMAKSSSNYQLPNILRTSGGSQLKSGLTVQPMQPRSTLSTFFPMSTSSTLGLQSRQVRTTAPSFMSPAQLIAPYRQHQLTPSSLNSNSTSLSGSLSFPITTQLPPAFVTSDLLENQVDLKTNNGDILIDIPSLVVPYLIEYPTRERLSIFIKELLAAEEKTKLEEARKEREKEMNDGEDVNDCDKEKSSKPDGGKNEDVPSVVVAEKVVTTAASEPILPEKKTFFDTTLGSFFVDIGLNLVQEWVQVELLRSQRKKLDKGWKTTDRERMVRSLTRSLEDYRQKNKVFRHPLKRCPMPGCAFKTESQIVMDHHLEVLHLHDGKYLCTYCPAQTVEPTEILRHVYERHKVFGRLEKKLLSHTCHQCPFEDTSKARLTRHLWKCQKTFAGEKNLSPPPDFEPPAKRVRLVAPISTLSMSLSTTPTTSSSNKMSLSIPTGVQGRATVQTPIRPKVTDLKAFTPFGSLKSTTSTAAFLPANLKTPTFLTGATAAANVLARSGTASATRLSAGGTLSHSPVLVPGSIHSAGYQIQQGQLYQVVNTTGGVVPMVGNPYNPQGFTILPTTATSMNTRGPTPVALIPNVARSMISTPSSAQRSPSPRVSSPLWRPPAPTLSAHSYRSTLSSLPMSSLSKLPAKPNISITPVTRTPSLPSVTVTSSTKTLPSATLTKTSTSPRMSDASAVSVSQSAGPGKPRFVVCEICDGYIKDLDQLRIHMQWIHKIKIHPKMIHNRPPLNCQKCQFRFFTDQGLERHLLGTHGLVTSSMQDSANKGKDGGRCTVCGRVFVWKLLVHMAKDHKMVLKPAHLSYKCTVCSATFNMYRLFENHVYEAHSTVAKRVLDKPGRGGSGVGISGMKAEDAPVTSIKSRSNAPSSSASSSSFTATPSRTSRGGSSSGSSRNPDEEDREVKTKCVECGIYFFQSGTCIHHWKKTHLRPCKVKLCRVDKCAKCRGRVDRPRRSCRSKPARISDGGDIVDLDSPLEEEQDDLPDIPPVEAAAPPPSLDGGIDENVLEIDDDDDDDDYDDDAELIEEDPMSRSSWNAEVGDSQSLKKVVGEEVSSGKNTNATTPRNTVIVIDQGGSENNDDTPFDMEVESHDHSELEEEVHTDVEED